MSFNEQEGTCSCTLRRSSITQDITRELLMLCYVVVVAMRLYLLSESSLSYVYAVGGNLQLYPEEKQHYVGHNKRGKYNSAYSIGFVVYTCLRYRICYGYGMVKIGS
ncbi:hypothetical protein TIFTF001_034384 [Ficus carica]|uniref:Uncharacterized protein n=1 Tax=Ficus carica TaxID=3494 RepID=A0AA88E042_FICCA|nr:hypothetical protein TIFTF001_034384 [Ficus carica]